MIKKLSNKTYYTLLFTIIAVTLMLVLFSTLPASTQPSVKQAGSESQFRVEMAYAYVGPLPEDKASYYSTRFNETMVHASKYPSAVFLNFTRIPSIQISSCDAVIQVYGVKITTDTGQSEYHAWTAGTAYNYTTFTQEDFGTIARYADELIDRFHPITK